MKTIYEALRETGMGTAIVGPFEDPEISTTFLTSIWTAGVKYEGFEDHST